MNDADLPEVIVCAGPPDCMLQNADAVANSMAGCPRGRHIVLHPDGSETEYKLKAN